MSTVTDFIKIFSSPSNDILFTECACYWFSLILSERFSNSRIMYNPHLVHFATMIDDKIYDIKGVVDDEEDYVDWEEYSSQSDDAELIIRNCIRIEGR